MKKRRGERKNETEVNVVNEGGIQGWRLRADNKLRVKGRIMIKVNVGEEGRKCEGLSVGRRGGGKQRGETHQLGYKEVSYKMLSYKRR